MSAWLIALTGFIYLAVAAEQAYRGNWQLAVTYFGYAFANVGLFYLAR